ncbi:hypothetical protein GCM10027589_38490 [Actinocorallia lasiicapitis]
MLAEPGDVRIRLTAHQTPDLVSLREQVLGEVRPVLAGDAGDERSPGQRNPPLMCLEARPTKTQTIRVKDEVIDLLTLLSSPGHGKTRT